MLSSAAIPDLTSASSEPVTWVLLRGLSRAGTNWGEFPRVFVNQLAKLQPDVRVLLLDLPGHGELRDQSSPSSIAALVEACRADLQRRGVGAPVHLLAMSLGALIASEWAARYPQEVRGAVLINTSLRPFSPVLRRLRPLAPLQFLGFVRSASAGDGVSSRVRLSNAWRQLLAALRFRASRARPEPPMLLLCSLGDGLVDWRCSQTLSRAWGVPLRMHTAAGHDLPQDDPPWVAAAVSEWVALRSQNETSAPR
ncbi:alpha/beta hydrolase [Pelomonas sp. V22]|uniref:alpha/beta fold hydrolase n=1 Tax=Pelomonas sp. V22 TaxID=2822139 RepID=UPI0024A985D7|nr:alpha/beta hydrolase [Pelomonas sp. V22]MDI4633620.1 alpha/beta hydrolase [Pelomonas sp. V22]